MIAGDGGGGVGGDVTGSNGGGCLDALVLQELRCLMNSVLLMMVDTQ